MHDGSIMEDRISIYDHILCATGARFVVIDENLTILTHFTPTNLTWFTNSGTDPSLSDLLELDSEITRTFKKWITIVRQLNTVWNWHKLEQLAPIRKVKFRNEHYTLSYSMVPVTYTPDTLLILINFTPFKNVKSDIPADFAQEHLYALFENSPRELEFFIIDAKQKLSKIQSLLNDLINNPLPENLRSLNQEIAQADKICIDTIYRDFHSVKGAAGSLGLTTLAGKIHDCESAITEVLNTFPQYSNQLLLTINDQLGAISPILKDLTEKMNSFINKHERNLTKVSKDQLTKVVDLCTRTKNALPCDQELLMSECIKLQWQPLFQLTKSYTNNVEQIAQHFGKEMIFVLINDENELFPPEIFNKVNEILLQIIRNCAVHGIEDRTMRQTRGKGIGKITLEIKLNNGLYAFSISDDGNGIDSEALVKKVIQKKVIDSHNATNLTETEKVNLVFSPGISTTDQITPFAGRGIGLDLVYHKILQLQGTISITTKKHHGTTFLITLPSGVSLP